MHLNSFTNLTLILDHFLWINLQTATYTDNIGNPCAIRIDSLHYLLHRTINLIDNNLRELVDWKPWFEMMHIRIDIMNTTYVVCFLHIFIFPTLLNGSDWIPALQVWTHLNFPYNTGAGPQHKGQTTHM